MHNKRKTAEESESSKRNKRTYEFKSGREYFTRTSLGDWSAAAAIEAYTSTSNLPLDELYQIMECDLHELSQKRSNYIEPARRMLSDLGLIMNFARKQQRAAGNHQYNVSKNNHVEINNALINKPSYNVDKKIDERSEVESATGNERTENENTAPEQHKGIQAGTNLRADEGRDSQTQRKQEEKEEAIRLNSFENSFRLMQDDQKWKLQSTGRYVEDVLFNYGKSMTKEHLCHSFVIDPWDQTYLKEKIFNAEEIAEMKRFNTKCLPKMPHDLKEYLKLYERARSAQEARNIIMMPQVWDNPFDREKYFDHDWIRSSYYQIVREIEAGHIQKNDNLESWVIARVWTIVDRVFDDIENMSVIRGESTSKASSIRKNSRRLPQGTGATKRRKMGRRLDLIFRKKNLEYGGGEAGKDYTADTDTKLLNERDLKLPKALKDMLDLLISQNIKKEKIRKLEVIGLLQYDLTMSMIRLDAPAGYVYRMTRTGNVTVPHDFSQLPELRKVLYMAWCGKAIVRQAIEELEKMDKGEEDDDLEQVMEPIDNEEAILAATFTSPEQPDRYRPSYSLDE